MRALFYSLPILLLFAVPDARAEARADIVALMDSVKTENLDATVHHLVDYGTRFAGSVQAPACAGWLLQKLQDYGWETALSLNGFG